MSIAQTGKTPEAANSPCAFSVSSASLRPVAVSVGMGNILEIEDLHVRYHDGTVALDGASLTVAQGERVALIGPNGAGKTSFLLAILGGVPSTGKIVVDGIELRRPALGDVRGRCGMTFQNPDDQLFMPTLLDDVAFGPLNQGLSPAAAQETAKAAIEAVGLAGLENRSPHHLSGGQKRSASLATIVAMNVKLLLLDEPAANLDFRSRRRLLDILTRRPEAMLLATHDLRMVEELCSRVVLLDAGHVVADRPTGEILADAALLSEHGLG